MANTTFNEQQFENKLVNLKDSQESINSLSSWCLQNKDHHKKIVNCWLHCLKRVKIEQRLSLFYLANDVIQYSKRKHYQFVESWGTALQKATTLVRDDKVKSRIMRIFKIWDERGVYDEAFIADLCGLLTTNVKKKTETNFDSTEFQPSILISKIQDCKLLEADTDLRLKKVKENSLHLTDAKSMRTHLKDRRHGTDVVAEVDAGVKRMEAYVKALELEIAEREKLIEILHQAALFYESQRGEAKIVCNAYRNFGNKVKLLKRKLDELIPTLSDSPIPSPDVNAPSPSSDSDFELPEKGRQSHNAKSGAVRVNNGRDFNFTNTGTFLGNSQFSEIHLQRDLFSDTTHIPSQLPNSNVTLSHNSNQTENAVRPIEVINTREQKEDSSFNITDFIKSLLPAGVPKPEENADPTVSQPPPMEPLQPPPMPPIFTTNDSFSVNWKAEWGSTNNTNSWNHQAPSQDWSVPPPVSEPWIDQQGLSSDTPESPPLYEKKGVSQPVEYDDSLPTPALVDVDHRTLLPLTNLRDMDHRVEVDHRKFSKLGPKDVDHRNLISLTGSPNKETKPLPPPPAFVWPADQDYRCKAADTDYRVGQRQGSDFNDTLNSNFKSSVDVVERKDVNVESIDMDVSEEEEEEPSKLIQMEEDADDRSYLNRSNLTNFNMSSSFMDRKSGSSRTNQDVDERLNSIFGGVMQNTGTKMISSSETNDSVVPQKDENSGREQSNGVDDGFVEYFWPDLAWQGDGHSEGPVPGPPRGMGFVRMPRGSPRPLRPRLPPHRFPFRPHHPRMEMMRGRMPFRPRMPPPVRGAERGPLKRHISKSASDLSERGRLTNELERPDTAPCPSTSGPANSAQSVPQLSVAQKTHSFFNTLRIRWSRSRSRERKCKKKLEDACMHKDSASTDYAADYSSDHSSSATQSPQHKARVQQHSVDPSPLAKPLTTAEANKSQSSTSATTILPSLPIFPTTSDESKSREAILCQHSFFQLRIHLKRGVDLIARDKGGTSDPYVKFKVGGRLLYKSKTIYRDLNPVWDEIFTIPIEDAFVPVHIKVFDYDWGLQDDFMGSAYLDLTKLDLGKPTEVSLELLDPGKTEYLGEIFLTATLVPKTQEDKDLYFQRSGKIGEVNRRLKSQIWSSVVTIVLVEGKNLQPMDIDGFSDPYVKFRLGNEKYKSKVVYKNLNPSWLEQFDFHLYDDQTQELEVTVWDKDKSKDDFMGRCSIDLSLLEREKTHGLWQDLEEGGGSIHLLLTISGTTASETISDLTTYEDNVRERKNIENRYALRHSFHNLRDVGHLTVKVYRATGLAAADLGGKSDPFCVLELVNARLQTQTEYKTLSPSWQKIFTFNVKDINSVLEVTVYDEDRDHKVEFLGKVAIPLLRIKNGEKRWYCLKDKKLHARAKGNCPMILLEMYVVWNPIRACVRTLNPKEEKYMQGEMKFKRQVFVRNVLRLKAIIMIVIEWGKLIQDCFEWERPAQSAVALVAFIALCYYFEPYMIPAALLVIFLKYYMVIWLTGGKSTLEDDEDLYGDDEEDDEEKDKEEKKSLKERLQAIQEVTQTVQNAIGYIASLGEQIKNTFNFTVPFISYLAIGMTLAAMVVMYIIPVRYLIMIAGVNKFARKLLRPHTIPNNEVLDLLSRVPDDEDLIAYREFRPYTSSDVDRRQQRKKHKAS